MMFDILQDTYSNLESSIKYDDLTRGSFSDGADDPTDIDKLPFESLPASTPLSSSDIINDLRKEEVCPVENKQQNADH